MSTRQPIRVLADVDKPRSYMIAPASVCVLPTTGYKSAIEIHRGIYPNDKLLLGCIRFRDCITGKDILMTRQRLSQLGFIIIETDISIAMLESLMGRWTDEDVINHLTGGDT